MKIYLWLARLYGDNSGHTAGLGAGLMALATMAAGALLLCVAALVGLLWWLFR